jgi:N-acetylglucosamine kinase-like BadF-type ATPase
MALFQKLYDRGENMDYVIGIDSGGTKTHIRIASIDKQILYDAFGLSGNIYANSKETLIHNFKNLIFSGLKKTGLVITECKCIAIGSAGVCKEADKRILIDIMKPFGFDCRIIVTNDAHIALCGGLDKTEGIVLISGTGSICYGINSKEQSSICGGYGHLLSDEGSAYHIAMLAMRRILYSADARLPFTSLTQAFCNHLKLRDPIELIDFALKNPEKEKIADLAQIVDMAARDGDKVAIAILKDSAADLFDMVKTVYQKLFLGEAADVLLTGSTIGNCLIMKNELERLLNSGFPLIRVSKGLYDAAHGAILIALSNVP